MRVLERVAKRWGISKSEALRRAVRALAVTAEKSEPESTLDDLQAAAAISPSQATQWVKQVREERAAASRSASRRTK